MTDIPRPSDPFACIPNADTGYAGTELEPREPTDYFDPYEVPKPGGPQCAADGTREDTYGGEHYWTCTAPGTVDVDGELLCEDHAGERGYGPKQEDYGFDPDDAPSTPTPSTGEER